MIMAANPLAKTCFAVLPFFSDLKSTTLFNLDERLPSIKNTNGRIKAIGFIKKTTHVAMMTIAIAPPFVSHLCRTSKYPINVTPIKVTAELIYAELVISVISMFWNIWAKRPISNINC